KKTPAERQLRGGPHGPGRDVVSIFFFFRFLLFGLPELRLERVHVEVELLLDGGLIELVHRPANPHFRTNFLALEILKAAISTGSSHGADDSCCWRMPARPSRER